MILIDKDIKEAIAASGFATEQDVAVGEKIAHDQNRPLIDVLIERGILLEKFLGQAIADYIKFPYVDLKNRSVPDELLKIIPENIASEKRLIAFELKDGTVSI